VVAHHLSGSLIYLTTDVCIRCKGGGREAVSIPLVLYLRTRMYPLDIAAISSNPPKTENVARDVVDTAREFTVYCTLAIW